ncbi:MAG: hypothetical protein ACFB13_08275 [Kiloniellaceae bacterium]
MRAHLKGASALAVAVVMLATAGCGGGPRGFYESGPPRIPAGGSFSIQPGQDVVIYGVRSKRCGMEPPTFETAAGEMFSGTGSQGPAVGEVYDAGIGQQVAVLCGGTVPVRAIGYRAPDGFEGEVPMTFYGTDQATVTVALPAPEPDPEAVPEPALDPAEPSEPAPVADPDVTPPPGTEPAPEPNPEAGPPDDTLPESPLNN